jgi:nitroreductase
MTGDRGIRSGSADALRELLHGRWSCRAFLPLQVPRPVIDRMLMLAQRSPSWCNTQPWQLEVTSGAATQRFREALGRHVDSGAPSLPDFPMPKTYTGIHRERRRASGWQLYDAVGVTRGDRAASAAQAARNFEFFDAPHVAIVTTAAEQGVYGAVDGGLYVGNLLLAAEALGVAMCPQAAVAHHAPFIRRYFDIDETRNVLVAVSFGYADESDPANSFRTERADLDEVVRHYGD